MSVVLFLRPRDFSKNTPLFRKVLPWIQPSYTLTMTQGGHKPPGSKKSLGWYQRKRIPGLHKGILILVLRELQC